MCYAIPGKLVEKKDPVGVIDYYGEKRNVVIACSDVEEGDYVYAQGGVLIRKISEKEALEVLEAWKDIFFELKETDKKLAEVKASREGVPVNILDILQKVNLGKELSREDLVDLLEVKDKKHLKLIYDTANNTRQKVQGNACCVHGILEFSNVCRMDCHWCGIRSTKDIARYKMTPEEILKAAEYGVNELGFKALVIQSGEDNWYSEEKLAQIVRSLKKLGILIFLSIGSRSKETYKRLFDEGARAALLRFETSDEDLFRKFRPGTELSERLDLIRYIRGLGYVLATGFIMGLPGESSGRIIDDILLTRSLKPDMYSFGPLIPSEGTPLEGHGQVDKDTVLKAIAACRFADNDAKILVTTALETLDVSAKREALSAGANSMMINITPPEYKKLYSIYDRRAGVEDEVRKSIKEALDLLYSLGRAPTDLGI